MNKILRIFLILTITVCAGCKVGPSYERPPMEMPSSWRMGPADVNSIANVAWWNFFEDETLTDLIQTALEQNKDLLVALARIDEARGLYRTAYGQQFPQLDATAEAGRSQNSKEVSPGAKPGDSYEFGAELSWQLDLWGELARSTEAARAELLASEQVRRGVVLTLVNDVAQAYFELQNLDRQIEITEQTVRSRQRSLEIAQKRFEGGVTSRLEVIQSESELASAMAILPDLRSKRHGQENALSVLLGRNPGPIIRGMNIGSQSLPEQLPSGLPVQLLQRRPDILAAEYRLMAATSRIGVAQAQFYPRITFLPAIWQEAPHLSSLFNSHATAWEVVGEATSPIFSAGRLEGNLEAAKARYEQARLQYEQTVLRAFQEVDTVLTAYYEAIEVRKAQQRLLEANTEYANLAWVMYANGEVAYIDYLDSERRRLDANLRISQIIRDQLNALVRLYTALGGGWNAPADPNDSNGYLETQ